jgi:hypothetical protein
VTSVHAWTERGDLQNAGQEEGRRQEGRSEEEEVSALDRKGGWTDHPPRFFRELTAGAGRSPEWKGGSQMKKAKKASPKKATKKKK